MGRGVIDLYAIIDKLKETEFDGQVFGELGLEGTEEMRDYMVDELGLRLQLNISSSEALRDHCSKFLPIPLTFLRLSVRFAVPISQNGT